MFELYKYLNFKLLNTFSRNKRWKNFEEPRWWSQSALVWPFCNFMFRCQNLICSKHQLIVRSIVPPTLLAHHPAKHIQTHRTHKSHKYTYTQTTDIWAIFFQICSNLVPRVFSFSNRDLTKLRRRRQRDCQKAKQQLCTCITLFCTLLCSPCTTTTWNDAILS